MLKKIAIGLIVVILAFVGFVATRPSTYRVERSITISAPVDIVFAQVNDLRRWAEWSPWDKLDPQMKKTYEGPQAGEGASYSWAGNDQVGKGRMTITGSKPDERIDFKLEFLEPWTSTNTTDFTFKPSKRSVEVTWGMSGNSDLMGKLFGMFMDMDAMIGKDFEKGLATLKDLSEAEAKRQEEAAAAKKAAEEEAAKAAAAAGEAAKAGADGAGAPVAAPAKP